MRKNDFKDGNTRIDTEPLISVAIPAHNAEGWIESTIYSVVDQTHRNIEIVLVDDGSTDSTADIVLDVFDRIENKSRYIKNTESRGVCFTRNRALAECRGKYVVFLDADDLLLSNCISLLAIEMERNSEVVMCFGFNVPIDHENRVSTRFVNQLLKTIDGEKTTVQSTANIIESNPVGSGSGAMIRNTEPYTNVKFSQIMSQDNAEGTEDWLYYFEMSLLGSVLQVNRVLVGYRQHGDKRVSDNVSRMLRSFSIFKQQVNKATRGQYRNSLKQSRLLISKFLLGKIIRSGQYHLLFDVYIQLGKENPRGLLELTQNIFLRVIKKFGFLHNNGQSETLLVSEIYNRKANPFLEGESG